MKKPNLSLSSTKDRKRDRQDEGNLFLSAATEEGSAPLVERVPRRHVSVKTHYCRISPPGQWRAGICQRCWQALTLC